MKITEFSSSPAKVPDFVNQSQSKRLCSAIACLTSPPSSAEKKTNLESAPLKAQASKRTRQKRKTSPAEVIAIYSIITYLCTFTCTVNWEIFVLKNFRV